MSAKLEIAILAGTESKQFLASLTAQLDRLEKLAGKINTEDYAGSAKEDENSFESTDQSEIEEEESFEAPAKKTAKKKAKVTTVEDVIAACKKHREAGDFKTTKALLLKKFKVESVHDLKAAQYDDVIAAMTVDLE